MNIQRIKSHWKDIEFSSTQVRIAPKRKPQSRQTRSMAQHRIASDTTSCMGLPRKAYRSQCPRQRLHFQPQDLNNKTTPHNIQRHRTVIIYRYLLVKTHTKLRDIADNCIFAALNIGCTWGALIFCRGAYYVGTHVQEIGTVGANLGNLMSNK